MSTIDLNDPPPNHTFSVAVEREETTGERSVRLFKDVALFIVALGFVVAVAILCYQTLASASTSPEEKKWAQSVFTAAMGGLVGYLIRK